MMSRAGLRARASGERRRRSSGAGTLACGGLSGRLVGRPAGLRAPRRQECLPHTMRLPHKAMSLPHKAMSLPHKAMSLPHKAMSLPHRAMGLPHGLAMVDIIAVGCRFD